MIPVTLQPNRRRYTAPCFTCFHCHGEFRIRGIGGKKLFCVDCESLVEMHKSRATQAVKRAVKAGHIKPANTFSCVDCGSPADRYDHRDYSQRLAVEPVCCSCNGHRGPAILGASA